MPPDVAADEIRDEIAASFLRSAADTLTARLRKDLPAGRDWLIELTARLGIPNGDRGAAMARARREADGALARARALDQRVITSRDPAYPALLTQIADPPLRTP